MVEQIKPNLYRIVVPLPDSPLQSINSYLVKAPGRNLIIDTGMLRPECEQALRAGLDELDVDLTETDLFITHVHADHLGLVGKLATAGSKVYFNRPDGDLIDDFRRNPGAFIEKMIDHAIRGGFSRSEVEESLRKHPGMRYSSPDLPPFHILADEDELTIGEYSFTVVATPGHTPGHLCLYEPSHKLLLSGDHVLGDITPNISVWRDDDDSLGSYLESLDKVAALDVDLVLPGHRSSFTDLRGRVAELKLHHQNRIDEVLAAIDAGSRTVYEIAARMTWDIVADSWDAFPVVQKWFAVSEAASHLRYLERRGEVSAEMSEESFVFDAV
jgi:glyoxylase-like metal-dependent hydrolase (beta-lactamase superfamily II)